MKLNCFLILELMNIQAGVRKTFFMAQVPITSANGVECNANTDKN